MKRMHKMIAKFSELKKNIQTKSLSEQSDRTMINRHQDETAKCTNPLSTPQLHIFKSYRSMASVISHDFFYDSNNTNVK